MASEKLIKRRMKSAKNISQITRAMQMVAASKMKKAQNLALSGRPYTEKIAEMVKKFVAKIDQTKHPLLKMNTAGKTLIILISTNKGLCGGLNTNLFRTLTTTFNQEVLGSAVFITVGKKGEQFIVKSSRSLIADFSETVPISRNIPSLTTLVSQGYIRGEYKEVYVLYNNFLSALRQEPITKRLLPLVGFDTKNGEEKETENEFLVEPGIDEILNDLLFHYLENQIRDAVLEAEASEHSARMLAMKNATDNAKELMRVLTLEYNKARQEKITYEIADMVTARLAVG